METARPRYAADAIAPATRRATRSTSDRYIGGVAGGLAEHLGLPSLWVRLFFVLTISVGGLGTMLYAGWWLVLPTDERFYTSTPGAESAERTGKRPGQRGRIRRLIDSGPAVALLALGVGVLALRQAWFGAGVGYWGLIVGIVGVGLIWRQADEAQSERWADSAARIDPFRAIFGDGSWAGYGRLFAGLSLIIVSLAILISGNGGIKVASAALPALVLGLIGFALVVGPWMLRLASDLSVERTERIRSQERADVAAHLHDSVLQTLALIQKNSADAALVARLARSQERDLRSWLYADEQATDATLAGALRRVAGEVEDTHGIEVEVVAVGDYALTDDAATSGLRALVAATREALINAAKHAGVPRVDVYAEVLGGSAEVFVRDRGAGFDPGGIAEDRHGVRDSIIDRMNRHGGSAEVRSTPGGGTEVRLRMQTGQPAGGEHDE
ncbi:MAG: PspC domain-containing protein [Nocardioides sp.]